MTTALRVFAWLLAAAVTFATLGPPRWRAFARVRSCRTCVRDRLFTATAAYLGDLSGRYWRARNPAALGTGKACTAGGFRSRCTGSLHRAGYNGWTGLDEAAAALEHEAVLKARVGSRLHANRKCRPVNRTAFLLCEMLCFVTATPLRAPTCTWRRAPPPEFRSN